MPVLLSGRDLVRPIILLIYSILVLSCPQGFVEIHWTSARECSKKCQTHEVVAPK